MCVCMLSCELTRIKGSSCIIRQQQQQQLYQLMSVQRQRCIHRSADDLSIYKNDDELRSHSETIEASD